MKLWIKIKKYEERNSYFTVAKNKQDKDLVGFVELGFKQGTEPTEDCEIELKDAFFTCYKNKKDEVKTKLFIMDYNMLRVSQYDDKPKEEVTPYAFENTEDPYANFGAKEEKQILEDSLPF